MAKNNYFQFKKFTIYQQNVGLKVSTEACIFGAYIPCENATKILDIGTGTGILALMCCQRNIRDAQIDAIDIEENAYQQAKINVENSIFNGKINVFWERLQHFLLEDPSEKYDLVISNPPFFEAHLPAQNIQKQYAKHTDTLSFEDLAKNVIRLLSENGQFWVIFPPKEMTILERTLEKNGLFLLNKIKIFQNKNKEKENKIFREICGFSFQQNNEILEENFCIYAKNDENPTQLVYSSEFRTILSAFYLYL